MHKLSIAVIGLLITGLSSVSAQRSPQLQFQDDQYACTHSRPDIKTYVDLERCSVTAMRVYLIGIRFPWMDLEDANEADRFAIAGDIDAGRIPLARGLQEMSDADDRMTAAINARIAATQQSQQADYQRRLHQYCEGVALMAPTRSGTFGEALYNSMAACSGLPLPQSVQALPPPQPIYPPLPAPPVQTNCQVLDNNVYCQSH